MDAKVTFLIALSVICGTGCATPASHHFRNLAQIDDGSSKALDFKNLPFKSKIPVPGSPDWMAVGFDSLWAPMDGFMIRIHAKDDSLEKIELSADGYRGVVTGLHSVWTYATSEQKLIKVNPKDNSVESFSIKSPGSSEGSIGISADAVWLVSEDSGGHSCLAEIEKNGYQRTCIPVDAGGAGVVGTLGSVWVTHPDLNQVTQIDTKTETVIKKIKVGQEPRFIAAGFGSVWVLNQGDGKITRIDAHSGEVIGTVDANLRGGGGDIAVGDQYIWASMNSVPVSRIDPDTLKVDRRYEGGSSADAIRAGLNYIWVSDRSTNSIWKIEENL